MDSYHISHIDEEMLERYSLNQLREEEVAPVEEHLLICPSCQTRLDEADQYVQTMKQAIISTQKDQTKARTGKQSLLLKPGWALACAAAVVALAAVIVIPVRRSNTPEVDIQLIAARGGDSLPIAQGRSGARFYLHMDATEIVKADSYSVELVNERGEQVWRGSTRAHQNELQVEVSRELKPGKYWARLFDSSKPPVLIREYGLELN
jgi:hypothetical protein